MCALISVGSLYFSCVEFLGWVLGGLGVQYFCWWFLGDRLDFFALHLGNVSQILLVTHH